MTRTRRGDEDMYHVILSKIAQKHKPFLDSVGLGKKARELLNILADNPFQSPPSYEKLSGNLRGAYSRRINRQHRLVYKVYEREKEVHILSMWTHYEE